MSDHDQFADFIHQDAVKVWQDVGVRMGEMLAEMMDKRISGAAFRERGREKTNGGCTSGLDPEADRKSAAFQRCRDTGGQPFESAPATPEADRLAEWERHGSHRWGLGVAGDLYDLECRVAAIEKTNHDAAPAAKAPTDASPLRSSQSVTAGMGTGDTQEPVAWAVFCGDSRYCYDHYDDECEAQAIADMLAGDDRGDGLWHIVPLYREPQTCPYVVGRTTQHCSLTQFTLTDEEREALRAVVSGSAVLKWHEIEAVVRSLLERTKCTP